MDDILTLLDWKRRVFALYQSVRSAADPEEAWGLWRETRDDLYRDHPQSPLSEEARRDFGGLDYFDYDPRLRVLAEVSAVEPEPQQIGASGDQSILFRRFAVATFDLDGAEQSLELHWLEGYGGGIFLAFADATSGSETYGGGRYVLDSVKGADLGMVGGALVLDLNFAYNPSCAYDARWICPLAPPANRLTVAIRAGERLTPS
ncbi:MAG: DUF1684 domain-containing protein [Actinobacteria bacterium]|jgi:uncharacterized protein (DUF1684 family)|nr:DUF1684 domain-containing protein [Actinomycetota bacterium]